MEEPNPLLLPKYYRRPDLSTNTRLQISIQAYTGTLKITELAKQYGISRTFIYQLVAILINLGEQLFGIVCDPTVSKQAVINKILSYRLEGHCSIMSISTLLRYDYSRYCSTSFISEILQYYGSQLPNTIGLSSTKTPIQVIYASDEIFAKGQPVLMTVAPY